MFWPSLSPFDRPFPLISQDEDEDYEGGKDSDAEFEQMLAEAEEVSKNDDDPDQPRRKAKTKIGNKKKKKSRKPGRDEEGYETDHQDFCEVRRSVAFGRPALTCWRFAVARFKKNLSLQPQPSSFGRRPNESSGGIDVGSGGRRLSSLLPLYHIYVTILHAPAYFTPYFTGTIV